MLSKSFIIYSTKWFGYLNIVINWYELKFINAHLKDNRLGPAPFQKVCSRTLLHERAENDEKRLSELEQRRVVQLEAKAASHRVGCAHQKGRNGGHCDHAAPQQVGEGMHELPDARHGRRAVDEKTLAANTIITYTLCCIRRARTHHDRHRT